MKRNNLWRLVSLALITLSLSACTKTIDTNNENMKQEDGPAWERLNTEPITFDWYINYSWYTTPWGHNTVSKAITDATGVSLNFIVPSGNESQKLDAMVASDRLPDFITLGWWEPQVQTMMDEGMVYALNELADEYDPYFYQVIDGQVVDWYEYEDGNLYVYPNSSISPSDYENNEVGSNQNFLVKKDIYEAIGSPDMSTKEGFASAIKLAAEMFPTVYGKPLIPIGADEFNSNGCNSFDKYLQNFLAIPFEKDGIYYDRYTDEEYISWLKVFRQLGSEGYLSPEIFLDKRAQLEEKMAEGRYFCLFYQSSDIQVPQKKLYTNDPDSIYIAVAGPANSAGDDPVLPGTGINGWTLTMISKNNKDPERAIAFMSYLLSEEGQRMVYLGVEGETYEIVDGQYTIKPEVEAVLNTDREAFDALYGSDDTYWMLQNIVMQEKMYKRKDPLLYPLKEWTYPYTEYTGQYDIVFEADSPYNSSFEKIQQLWGNTLPQLLLAPDDESFDAILASYKEKRASLGFDEIIAQSTLIMQESKARLGME